MPISADLLINDFFESEMTVIADSVSECNPRNSRVRL